MVTDKSIVRFEEFRSTSDWPQFQPDPFVLKTLDGLVDTFRHEAAYLRLPASFIESMIENFAEAFRRLDTIGRDDPFWNGTNRRPTQYKLYSACEVALQANPMDCQALWLKLGVAIVFGQSFVPELWERLAVVQRVDPTWIVSSAIYAECHGGAETASKLVELLKRLQLSNQVTFFLQQIAAAGKDEPGRMTYSREHSADWATRVFDQYEGGNQMFPVLEKSEEAGS